MYICITISLENAFGITIDLRTESIKHSSTCYRYTKENEENESALTH